MFVQSNKERERQAQALLSQIARMTNPELVPVQQEHRQDVRRSRVFPVLLTPWEDGVAAIADSVYALTKDVSDHGLALVLQAPYRIQMAVVGLVMPSPDALDADAAPQFVLGAARQNVPLGGGYWQLGLKLTELMSLDEHPSLKPLLLPTKVVSKITCANLLKKGSMH